MRGLHSSNNQMTKCFAKKSMMVKPHALFFTEGAGRMSNTSSKLFHGKFIRIMAANTLSAFSFYMISTLLSTFLTERGIRLSIAGIIIGLFSITALLIRPICGILSDSCNKILLIRIAAIIMTAGLFGYTLTSSVPLLIFFRIIHGVGFAVCSTAMVALAADYIPDSRMGEGIGYMGLGQVISSAIAPGIGIAIADHVGILATFFSAGIMSACVFVFMFLLPLKDCTVKKEKSKITFSNMISAEVLPFTIIAGIFSFMNGMIATYLVQFAAAINISKVSLYFTVCAVFLFIARPIAGKLMDKKGLDIVVIPGIVLACISAVLLGKAGTLSLILMSGVIRSLGQGAAQPSLQAACINKVGKAKSGIAVSTFLLGGDIGQGISPMIGGYLAERYNYEFLFYFCAVLMFGAFLYYLTVRNREKGEKAIAIE